MMKRLKPSSLILPAAELPPPSLRPSKKIDFQDPDIFAVEKATVKINL